MGCAISINVVSFKQNSILYMIQPLKHSLKKKNSWYVHFLVNHANKCNFIPTVYIMEELNAANPYRWNYNKQTSN